MTKDKIAFITVVKREMGLAYETAKQLDVHVNNAGAFFDQYNFKKQKLK